MRYAALCALAFTGLTLSTQGLAQMPAAAPATAPAAAPATAAPAPVQAAAPAMPAQNAPPSSPTATPMAAEPTPSWMNYENPYIGEQNDIVNPNRTPDEIVMWAAQQATNALTLTPKDFNEKLTKIKSSFTPQGWNEFATYARAADLPSRVQTRDYSVTTVAKGDGLVIDSGPVAGSFHWLVKLPLMITFLHPDKMGDLQPVEGGDYDLMLQIGRVAQGTGGPDDMAIEGWRITPSGPQADAPQ